MVDGEQRRSRGLGGGSQVDGRLPAPGPDLDEGRRGGRGDVGLAGSQGGGEQRLPLVVGHEAPRAARHVRRVTAGGPSRVSRPDSAVSAIKERVCRRRGGSAASPSRSREPKATLTRSRSTDWATRRGPDESGWSSRNATAPSANSASPHRAGMDSTMRGGAFFGKRSSTASQLSVNRVHTAWLPIGVGQERADDANPFWLRTSVMARSKVRRHRSTSGNPASAPSERISSWGVEAVR